jgi:hypothetical protein
MRETKADDSLLPHITSHTETMYPIVVALWISSLAAAVKGDLFQIDNEL